MKNDLNAAVPKFCLAVEEHRRTADGRVRTSQEFLAHFFPHDDKRGTDQIFRYIPNDVRGPILSQWGIRGLKAAMRDSDEKVESVVHDALVAGDVDHAVFEQGLVAEVVVRWVPLASWWTFWRGGKLAKKAIGRALETAYDLQLFDARWLLDTVEARGGKLRGTDVIAEGLTKADLTDWVKRIHATGDGSAKGILAAIGWERIVTQTANEVLVAVLDALAAKIGLTVAAATASASSASIPSTTKTGGSIRPRFSENAPELVVGETALGENELGALSEEALAIVVDEDVPSSDVEVPPVDGDTERSRTRAVAKTPAPAASESELTIDIRKLVEEDDEEEDQEETAVFALDKPTSDGAKS